MQLSMCQQLSKLIADTSKDKSHEGNFLYSVGVILNVRLMPCQNFERHQNGLGEQFQ
ncbi:Uncharacterised protein [Salmonella enterica subsp. houtenae]|nr:Uncharacterised protein [Salmonella enterica]VEA90034.1 Uncharacterised protein [Salmonella enterica subsp. houtenae]VUD22877.1 Uncharacterised protein [Salmonella sp. NCTC 7297]